MKEKILKILFINREILKDARTNLVITLEKENKEIENFLKKVLGKTIYITKKSDGTINYIVKDADYGDLKKLVNSLI